MIKNKDAKKLKKDFPIFKNNKGLVYLDNSATSQRPRVVIDSITDFMKKENANISRGVYDLAEKSTEKFEDARKIVAEFIGATEKEVIFTKGTTNSINMIPGMIKDLISRGKREIVLTEMEHHSNLIPWQAFAKRNKMKLKFIKMKKDFTLDLDDAKEKITSKTAIVSLTHVSNILGTINPIEQIVSLAKSKNAYTIIDAAQSAPHIKINVKEIDCDFLAFSSHKMLGPFGIGILYVKEDLLKKLSPVEFGGGMVKDSDFDKVKFKDYPEKFEAGTQNISGIIGLAAAIRYLEEIGLDDIENWEKRLLRYALSKIKDIEGISVYNPGVNNSTGILSFNIAGVHPHDVASLLNEDGIAIRAGHGCAIPLIKKMKVDGVCRASFYFYNTSEDIDKLIEGITKIKEKFQ